MPDLADLYPGYQSHWIDTSAGKLFARTGGNGPPLLLLHGYAQTNVMWHRVAPALAEHFSLVIPDLPGYGWSSVPESGEGHAPYDKRSMAKAMVELMEKLGHIRFRLAGHDRGGRVAYRLALDHPRPVGEAFDARHRADLRHVARHRRQARVPHLALDVPRAAGAVSGKLIGRDPVDFWNRMTAPGTKAKIRRGVRPAGGRALPRVLQRSAAHPRDLRGLSRRPHHRLHQRRGRPRGRQEDRVPDAGAVGRDGHPAEPKPARSRRGANGRPTCAARPSIADTICRRKVRTRCRRR